VRHALELSDEVERRLTRSLTSARGGQASYRKSRFSAELSLREDGSHSQDLAVANLDVLLGMLELIILMVATEVQANHVHHLSNRRRDGRAEYGHRIPGGWTTKQVTVPEKGPWFLLGPV
jgi:hypothetical protein